MINISVYKQYGIYAIINIISGMSYIGQTHNNFGDRWDCHKALLRNNKHHNPLLQNDWDKYGEGKFKFIILYNCIHNESQEELDSLEEKYIKEYMENNNAYNLSKNKYDMRSFVTDEMTKRTGELNRQRILGTKLSDSTKKKMSETRKRKYAEMTEEEKDAYNKEFVNRMLSSRSDKWSEERKKKYSESQWEHPHSAKLSHKQVKEVRRLYEEENMKISDIAKLLGIKYATVYGIAHYTRWAHLK